MNTMNDWILFLSTLGNCTQNEFIVLPEDADDLFQMYCKNKANLIREAKNLYTPLRDNFLILEYPSLEYVNDFVFNRFFESPYVVSNNANFRGLFAIDVTNYTQYSDDYHFDDLLTYMQRNPDMVFVLFVCSNNDIGINKIYAKLRDSINIKKKVIPFPNPDFLTEYVIKVLMRNNVQVSKEAEAELRTYLNNHKYGFEFSNYFTAALEKTFTKDTIDSLTMKNLLGKMGKKNKRITSFGY